MDLDSPHLSPLLPGSYIPAEGGSKSESSGELYGV
jgi:hypothetical protein